jgi:hypothetical protein
VPASPEVPLDPDVPLSPLVPELPSVPEEPSVPEVPFSPDVPEVPLLGYGENAKLYFVRFTKVPLPEMKVTPIIIDPPVPLVNDVTS